MIDLKRLKNGTLYTKPDWVSESSACTLTFKDGMFIMCILSSNNNGYTVTYQEWIYSSILMDSDWYEVKNHLGEKLDSGANSLIVGPHPYIPSLTFPANPYGPPFIVTY
jgi:hypothetical protein